MPKEVVFDLKPLTFEDLPDPSTADFQVFLDERFEAGERLANSMEQWSDQGVRNDGTVQIRSLTTSGTYSKLRKSLGVHEFWCGRISTHTPESLAAGYPTHSEEEEAREAHEAPFSFAGLRRSLSRTLLRKSVDGSGGKATPDRRPSADLDEVARQARVMNSLPHGVYEHFRKGLLEYHSENEREYIESCRETECLSVLVPHVAEVWRLTYVTPPPTNPRTFVVLLLSRELKCAPHGERSFMNISLPFKHPDCPEKMGPEKNRVRGRYVSVELVRELEHGRLVEWRMATSSDAGGNIPRFMTNSALPKSISEDVPSFLGWMMKRYKPDRHGDATAGGGERPPKSAGTRTPGGGAACATPARATAPGQPVAAQPRSSSDHDHHESDSEVDGYDTAPEEHDTRPTRTTTAPPPVTAAG